MRRALPKANMLDRAISAIAPSWGAERMKARAMMAMAEAYTGASRNRRNLVNWSTANGDSDTELAYELPTLRQRSRDLIRNNMLACGAIKTKVTSIVGGGLTMQARLDRDILGLTEDQAEALETQIEREWLLWSESKQCTVSRTSNFREVQALALLSVLGDGDTFALLPYSSGKTATLFPYRLRVQLIEADRVCNPSNQQNSDTLAGGVQYDASGAVTGYHILQAHPGDIYTAHPQQWKMVNAIGSTTGRRNILHLYSQLRIDQSRGVPDLAPVIEGLKQFGTFTQATIDAAVIQTFLAVFVTSPEGNGLQLDAGGESDSVKLGSGAIIDLAEGEVPHFLNPTHPSTGFGAFSQEFYRQIGVAIGLPHEILIKHFTASFSAAQAALLEAWKFFSAQRRWLVDNLCQPVYEEFLAEAIATGRIQAPGFFSDPLIRIGYCGADWVGPPRGAINEDVQNDADAFAEDRGWKTTAQNCQERGGNWERLHAQRVKEVNRRKADGLIVEAKETENGPMVQDPEQDQ